jgi:hypothetical protein
MPPHIRYPSPQTEEVGLKTIAPAKISNKFSRSPRTYQIRFHGSPQIFIQVFHVCKRSPRHSKDYQEKDRSRDPNI